MARKGDYCNQLFLRIAIAQSEWAEREDVIDILIAIDIPDMAPTSPVDVDRIRPGRECGRPLAARLRATRDKPNGLIEQFD